MKKTLVIGSCLQMKSSIKGQILSVSIPLRRSCSTWRASWKESDTVISLISSAIDVSIENKNSIEMYNSVRLEEKIYLRRARDCFVACIWGNLATNCFNSLTVFAPCLSSYWAEMTLALRLNVVPTAVKFLSLVCQNR